MIIDVMIIDVMIIDVVIIDVMIIDVMIIDVMIIDVVNFEIIRIYTELSFTAGIRFPRIIIQLKKASRKYLSQSINQYSRSINQSEFPREKSQ